MKNIDTLVDDIYKVVKGSGGWTGIDGAMMGSSMSLVANQRFSYQPVFTSEHSNRDLFGVKKKIEIRNNVV